jgi:hypothetical protein
VDRDEMLRVLRAFEREGLEYVLIGAAAMGFHGLIRATEDLFETVAAETKKVEGIAVPVATPLALYRLKRGTVRALDRQDAEAIRRRFDLVEK